MVPSGTLDSSASLQLVSPSSTIAQMQTQMEFLMEAYEERNHMLQENLNHRKWMESLIDDLRKK